MASHHYYNISLSFAAINQAAGLVHQLAQQGHCDQKALESSLSSILITEPTSTLAVFDKETNLQFGLTLSAHLLSQPLQKADAAIIRYCASLMALERRLSKNEDALNTLSARIKQIKRQCDYFPINADNIIGALSDIYIDVISPLTSKIQILGNADILRRPSVQARIRALLLAGVRAAVLWRQVGGNRWQILFRRNAMTKQILPIIQRF